MGNPDLKEMEKRALSEFAILSSAEESFLRQKSRNLWVAEGDNNSTYFHNCVKDRNNRNKLLSLTRDDDTVVYEIR